MIKQRSLYYFIVFLIGILFPVFLGAEQLPSYRKYQGPIKPGIVITKENFSNYLPELTKLLPPAKLKWYTEGVTKGIVTMPVVETTYYPASLGQQKATKKHRGTARIGADNDLVGWVAGIPFPDPKTAIEIAWDCYPTISRTTAHDDLWMYSWFGLFNKKKYEKQFVWNLFNRKYRGRTDFPPLGDMPASKKKGICLKESLVIIKPYEVRGFVQLRIRYWDIDKPDKCYAYIPAIRRVRRLTGNDLTDPLLGSDCVPDDFEVWRQKFTSSMKIKVLAYQDFLVPITYVGMENKPDYDYKKLGRFFQVNWEIRPIWVLEIMINDPNYVYSRRVIYIDGVSPDKGGNFLLYWGEQYDQKNRLWKANGQAAIAGDGKGFKSHFNWMFMNLLSSHYSVTNSYPAYVKDYDKVFPLKEDQAFSIKGLIKKAR